MWAEFQNQWDIMLRERYPIAPYIHMWQIVSGTDPFESRAGWTELEVDRLVSDAENLLSVVPTNEMCAFACSIDLNAHERLLAEGYDIGAPAVICAELGLGSLIDWYEDTHGLEKAHAFYDQNEKFIRSIKDRWLKATTRKKPIVEDAFWLKLAKVRDVQMRDTPGVQVADMIAWGVTRRITNAPDDKWAHLADSLIGDIDFPGVLSAKKLPLIDETMLRETYNPKRDL